MRFLTTIFCVITSLSAVAELPPLSEEERKKEASDIVSGYVKSIRSEVVGSGDFSDIKYTVKMIVLDIFKPIPEESAIKKGETIDFTYAKAKTRPDGWAGPSGQIDTVRRYSIIRAYLKRSANMGYALIEPNGFDAEMVTTSALD